MSCRGTAKKKVYKKLAHFFAPLPRADFVISALFPGKRAERRRKINFRPLSRKKGGKFIFRLGGGRRAEGGFYPGPMSLPFERMNKFITHSYIHNFKVVAPEKYAKLNFIEEKFVQNFLSSSYRVTHTF